MKLLLSREFWEDSIYNVVWSIEMKTSQYLCVDHVRFGEKNCYLVSVLAMSQPTEYFTVGKRGVIDT